MRDDCIGWSGYVNPATGYGTAYNPRTKRMDAAHRVAYEREVGPIPEGKELDHLCRFRACVNTSHLEPVTRRENARRGRKAKLSIKDVQLIRSSKEVGYKLARELGVTHRTVYDCRSRKTYKEVV